MQYDEKEYAKLFSELLKEGRIKSSNDFFKINLCQSKTYPHQSQIVSMLAYGSGRFFRTLLNPPF